jgi:hypothetical protein
MKKRKIAILIIGILVTVSMSSSIVVNAFMEKSSPSIIKPCDDSGSKIFLEWGGFFLHIEADLSPQEYCCFMNNYGDWDFYMETQYLPEDRNSDSYIKWYGLFPQDNPVIWPHTDERRYDYHCFYISKITENNIEYSNGRIIIKASGRNFYISLYSIVHPAHPTDKPRAPAIIGPTSGNVGKDYQYTIFSRDWENKDLYYHVDWGDGNVEDWNGPHASCQAINLKHIWTEPGTYTIKVEAKNSDEIHSIEIPLEVIITKKRSNMKLFYQNILEQHTSIIQRILTLLRHQLLTQKM